MLLEGKPKLSSSRYFGISLQNQTNQTGSFHFLNLQHIRRFWEFSVRLFLEISIFTYSLDIIWMKLKIPLQVCIYKIGLNALETVFFTSVFKLGSFQKILLSSKNLIIFKNIEDYGCAINARNCYLGNGMHSLTYLGGFIYLFWFIF